MNWTHTSTAAVAAKKSGAPNTAKIRKTVINVIVHIFLAILAFIWVLPIFWVILTSFRGEKGSYVSTFFPKTYTFNNYIKLFTDTSILNFPKMFMNTFVIAIFTCIISTIFVLSVAYSMSRMRFKMRKPFMNIAIITLSTIILWFLMNFGWTDAGFGMLSFDGLEGAALEAAQAECILAKIGSAIGWIFTPLGWTQSGNGWKMAVAAISGLIAKENVVATFGMLFGFAEVAEDGTEFWGNLAAVMTPVAAYGYLVFNLLCAPCFAAMGAIKREMNNTKWFWFAIGYQCGLAYVVSLCIYQIGTLITTGTFGIGTVVAFVLVIGLLYLLFRPYKESDTLKVNVKGMAGAR